MMPRRQVKLLEISQITAEQAAELTASCRVEPMGGGKHGENTEPYWIASLWCNKIGEHLCVSGKTALEAVINVHNEVTKR